MGHFVAVDESKKDSGMRVFGGVKRVFNVLVTGLKRAAVVLWRNRRYLRNRKQMF